MCLRSLKILLVAGLCLFCSWGHQARAQAPNISSLAPTSGPVSTLVTIAGSGFGSTQGTSTASLNGTAVSVLGWSDTVVVGAVPSGASSGSFSVTVNGQTANSASFAITSPTLPPGWSDQDICPDSGAYYIFEVPEGGSGGGQMEIIVGSGSGTSATYANNTFTVAGSGQGIGGTADGLNFVYQPLSGGGTIIARVVSVQGNAQAGVMIRETLDGDATEATTFSNSPYFFFYDRPSTSASLAYQGYAYGTSPYWIELARSGNTISSFYSLDGINWAQSGSSQTVTMAQNVYIGLAVSSENTSSLATATFDNVSVSAPGSGSSAPVITSLSATTGSIGSQIAILGSGFGGSQNGSVVILNGAPVTINTWSTTSINITIPTGTTSGPVVVSVAPSMNDSNPAMFEVTSQPLPTPWLDQDIGQVGETGSATYAGGVFTVTGSGAGITGVTDGMHFVYQLLSGNGTLIARVVSVQGMAGLMIRETLDANSTEGTTSYQAPYFTFFDRPSAGASLAYQSAAYETLPYWIELVRSGNTISSYYSPDGINWAQNGSNQTVTMAQNVYIGLGVSSGSNSSLATATFDNVSVSAPGSGSSAPVISSLSATTGSTGSHVTIYGSGFGGSQSGSVVILNGTPVMIDTWGATSISITIPTGATSGSMVVSVAPSMNDSNPVMFEVTSQPLPTPWLDQDVGQVGETGSATYASGVFTVNASGAGITGTTDGMHFVYQPLAGDGTIIARAVSVQGMAGVMIRETLTGSSTQATTVFQAPYFIFCDRPSTGASLAYQGYAYATLPYWIELVRSGNTISSYYSPDGINWAPNGASQTVTMAQNVYIGLAVSSENNSGLATATFDNVSISAPGSEFPTPVISSLSATTGSIGSQVTIYGSGFGQSQNGSVLGVVLLNGTPVTIHTWGATSISITIPTGATSGPLVVSVAPSMNNSNPMMFEVTSQPLPTPWLDQDVGQVGETGSATYASGVFTVNGSGAGITGTTDGMHFVYQPLQGDGTIVARVVSMQGMAGVMIRETLTGSSTQASTLYQAPYFYFYDRASTGASLATQGDVYETLPYWVELVRSGNTISSYYSTDGINWAQNGSSQTVSMVQNVYIGLAVSGGSNSSLAIATFDNVSISASGSGSSAPVISSLSVSSGGVSTPVTIYGTNFGSAQGSSTVTFNGTAATVAGSGWGPASIGVTVPSGAATGYIVVTMDGMASNGVLFTLTMGPSLVSIALSPASPTLAVNGTQQFTATGTFSDGSTQDITSSCNWSFSNVSIATVTNKITGSDPESGGYAIGLTAGTDTLAASFANMIGSTSVTVTAPPAPPAAPSITGISPTSGVGLTTVTVTGSGFGNAQGSGYIILGTALGVVQGWGPSQVVATVAPGSATGIVQIVQSGLQSNSVTFSINNPIIGSVTPSIGTPGITSVSISGAGFGSQGSGRVWIGGAMATVGTWNDTGISAVVPAGAVSGSVQVLQNGVWSNAVPFTVAAPHIISVSPNPYSPPTAITISGSGFGAQSSGTVWIGNMDGVVQTWNDTTVVANLASGALSGVVKVQQNGIWSNAVPFIVSPGGNSSNALTITPTTISLLVGRTHSIEAVNAQGQSVTGLTWASSDTTVVTLSSNDPPILTAVATGHVTITAGNASADVTVYSGTSLPVGTIQWTNSGDGSGVTKAVPAVPSASGVDVFAFQSSGTVAAITSDGTTLWTANVSNGYAIPDFQGGLVYVTAQTVQELNSMTGQPNPAYNYTSSSNLPVLVHTDGTIFTIDGDFIVGIDPSTGTAKFSIAMEEGSYDQMPICERPTGSSVQQLSIYSMTIAGDGNAYVVYAYGNTVLDSQVIGNCNASYFHNDLHLRALQISSSGSSAEFVLGDWTEDSSGLIQGQVAPGGSGSFLVDIETQAGNVPGLTVGSILTDADTGVVVSWSAGFPAYCAYQDVPYEGGANQPFIYEGCVNSSIVNQLSTIGGGVSTAQTSELLEPVLQRADGTFVGLGESDNSMIAFDTSGNIKWSVPNYNPQIVTADDGVIARTYNGVGTTTSTFDVNGNATGQNQTTSGSISISWSGNASYGVGTGSSLISQATIPPAFAPTYAALLDGSQTGNGTAIWEVLSPSGPSSPLQKQLPPQGASLNSNYNAIEILTTASPDTIFSKYLQTFNGAGYLQGVNDQVTMENFPPPPVTGSGQNLTFVLTSFVSYTNYPWGCGPWGDLSCGPLQGPFTVQTERFDTAAHTISVVTLTGHPLEGWRYFRVFSIGTNDLVIETGAVDTYNGGGNALSPLLSSKNWFGYYFFRYQQMKIWEEDLRYILSDLVQSKTDINAVQGTTPQYNVVQGVWNPQPPLPSQAYILNNVCQSTSCN
jgi:hypothetical protein